MEINIKGRNITVCKIKKRYKTKPIKENSFVNCLIHSLTYTSQKFELEYLKTKLILNSFRKNK